MSTRFLKLLGTGLALAILASCTQEPVTGPRDLQFMTTTSQQCEVVDFNQFTHGDAITSLSLFSGELSIVVSAFRNSPEGAVDATAYDTELWNDTDNPPPNSTHNDTQRNILCNDAANGGNGTCDGIMPVVPDPDFAEDGDDSGGGSITFDFPSGTYEIPTFAAADDDGTQTISLFVDGGATPVGQSSGLANGSFETVETSEHTFSSQALFTLEGSGGIDNIEVCREEPPPPPPPGGGEGCTPGYWKQPHHFDSWTAPYMPSTLFSDVFEDAFPGMTLLDVLKQGGGGLKALGRHTVAALLNAASPDVDYDMTTADVIAAFNDVFPGSRNDYEALKDVFEGFNEQGCPLN